jgi:hypothetical protein
MACRDAPAGDSAGGSGVRYAAEPAGSASASASAPAAAAASSSATPRTRCSSTSNRRGSSAWLASRRDAPNVGGRGCTRSVATARENVHAAAAVNIAAQHSTAQHCTATAHRQRARSARTARPAQRGRHQHAAHAARAHAHHRGRDRHGQRQRRAKHETVRHAHVVLTLAAVASAEQEDGLSARAVLEVSTGREAVDSEQYVARGAQLRGGAARAHAQLAVLRRRKRRSVSEQHAASRQAVWRANPPRACHVHTRACVRTRNPDGSSTSVPGCSAASFASRAASPFARAASRL